MINSIRAEYEKQGSTAFYKAVGSSYSNPHEKDIQLCLDQVLQMWKPPLNNVLDLACGSGEITSHIKANSVVGIDPYTHESYLKRTGKKAHKYTFEDIAKGSIKDHRYDLIICSFALHLTDKSRLPDICYALSEISSKLLILTPHKRPEIKWHWKLIGEHVFNRVRARWYEKPVDIR